jgi:1,4-alpha-glucan branching enzyme
MLGKMGYFLPVSVLSSNEACQRKPIKPTKFTMATKITFQLPANIVAEATSGILVGEFNNWDFSNGINLKKQKDGSLKTSVELEAGVYQYRYFLNDGRWVNDDRASNFVPDYQVENNVIAVEAAPVKEKAPAKAKAVKIEATVEAKPKAAKKAVAVKVEEPVTAAPVAEAAKPKKVAKKKA